MSSAMTEALAAADDAVQRELEDMMPDDLAFAGPPTRAVQAAVTIASGPITNADGGMTSGEILRARFSKRPNFTPIENSIVTHNGETWIVREVEGKESWNRFWAIKATRS